MRALRLVRFPLEASKKKDGGTETEEEKSGEMEEKDTVEGDKKKLEGSRRKDCESLVDESSQGRWRMTWNPRTSGGSTRGHQVPPGSWCGLGTEDLLGRLGGKEETRRRRAEQQDGVV